MGGKSGGGGGEGGVTPQGIEQQGAMGVGDIAAALNRAANTNIYATQLGLQYAQKNYDQSRNDLQLGEQKSLARNAPYRRAGYDATDRYLDLISMPRYAGGSA